MPKDSQINEDIDIVTLNKLFVFWLSWEFATLDKLETQMVVVCHYTIFQIHSTMQKSLWPWQEVATIMGC